MLQGRFSKIVDQLDRYLPNDTESEDLTDRKLFALTQLRRRVIVENHANITASNLGNRKTILRVIQRYYWAGLVRGVRHFVQHCDFGQRQKASQQTPASVIFTEITNGPWAAICTAFTGALLRLKRVHEMFQVLTDKFSKKSKLVPPCKATSKAVTLALQELTIGRFGALVQQTNISRFSQKAVHLTAVYGALHTTRIYY